MGAVPDFGPWWATTAGITVRVRPVFLPSHSDPAALRFMWAYFIRIENERNENVQLISRYWRIIDGLGRAQIVEGAGVVGEQPMIPPGGAHEYNSGCPLETPSGTMEGWYEMETAGGNLLRVKVPLFSLDSPHMARAIN